MSVEVETKAPAAQLFKAFFLDWHNLGPKLLPDIITSVVNLSGDGGPGSVRQTDFTSAVPFSFVKERLDFIDHEKFEVKETLVEGGELGNKVESGSSHFKIEPKGSGSVLKLVGTYKVVSGTEVSEDLEKIKENLIGAVKAVEGYLLANPHAYA